MCLVPDVSLDTEIRCLGLRRGREGSNRAVALPQCWDGASLLASESKALGRQARGGVKGGL